MAEESRNADEIRRRMAEIRRELHQGVQGVVAGAEAATDWKYYVRLYPWAALGAAVVAGYLASPRRHRVAATVRPEDLQAAAERVSQTVREEPREARPTSGIAGLALGFLGPLALRAAQNYAAHYVEQMLKANSVGPSNGPASPIPGTSQAANWSGRGPTGI